MPFSTLVIFTPYAGTVLAVSRMGRLLARMVAPFRAVPYVTIGAGRVARPSPRAGGAAGATPSPRRARPSTAPPARSRTRSACATPVPAGPGTAPRAACCRERNPSGPSASWIGLLERAHGRLAPMSPSPERGCFAQAPGGVTSERWVRVVTWMAGWVPVLAGGAGCVSVGA